MPSIRRAYMGIFLSCGRGGGTWRKHRSNFTAIQKEGGMQMKRIVSAGMLAAAFVLLAALCSQGKEGTEAWGGGSAGKCKS